MAPRRPSLRDYWTVIIIIIIIIIIIRLSNRPGGYLAIAENLKLKEGNIFQRLFLL